MAFSVFTSLSGPTRAAAADSDTAHDHAFTAISGEELPLSAYEGRLVLVVNTASQCGFTGQYNALQALHDEYRDRGLVVLGVPSNDFGRQEPGNEAEIADFTRTRYRVDFPLTAKTRVVGPDAAPFYRWASARVGALGRPRWNFHKFLIGADGRILDWFSTITRPGSKRLRAAVEANLPTVRTE